MKAFPGLLTSHQSTRGSPHLLDPSLRSAAVTQGPPGTAFIMCLTAVTYGESLAAGSPFLFILSPVPCPSSTGSERSQPSTAQLEPTRSAVARLPLCWHAGWRHLLGGSGDLQACAGLAWDQRLAVTRLHSPLSHSVFPAAGGREHTPPVLITSPLHRRSNWGTRSV